MIFPVSRNLLFCFIFGLFPAMMGCAAKRPPKLPAAYLEGNAARFYPGQIIDMQNGEVLDFDQLIACLMEIRVVFVGEVHSDPDHHLIQVQILQALMARQERKTVAMEFFKRPIQESLDRYMKGLMSESDFLDEINWSKAWGYDYHFYRPLILMVKDHEGEILAINAPNEIVRKVARSGIDSLNPEERGQLAEKIDFTNEPHRKSIFEVFQKHTHSDLKKFDFFYEAQCVWEDTMAESIADYLKKDDGKMVVLAGNGHIAHRFGIPDRVRQRIDTTMATVIPLQLTDQLTLGENMADYVWLTGDYMLGRFMERHTKKD